MPTVKKTLKEHDERRVSIRVRAGHPAPPIAPSPLLNAMQKTAEDVAKIVCEEIQNFGQEMERLLLLKKETFTSSDFQKASERLDLIKEPLSELLEALNMMNDKTTTLKFLLGVKERTMPNEAKVYEDVQNPLIRRDTGSPWYKYEHFGKSVKSSLERMEESLGKAKYKISIK